VNEHEKIKISWDEVKRVDTSVHAPVEQARSEQGLPPSPALKDNLNWKWMLGGIVVLFLILTVVVTTYVRTRSGHTVESWIAQVRPQWAAEISNSQTVRQYIEGIHPLVTYKRAAISEMRVATVDGLDSVGSRGENISEVEILVTFYWEGPVTKDGFTEVRFNYDYQGHQLKAKHFERSNAAVNLDTVDWFKVGVQLGILLSEVST
jgi:hypothetical protein